MDDILTGSSAAEANLTPVLAKYPPLLKNRNFILLWAGYVISALGDRIHFVVMLWLFGKLMGYDAGTRENSQLTIAMMLPFLLLGPFSGILADRLPRRVVMVVSDLVRVGIVLVARFYFLEQVNKGGAGGSGPMLHLVWLLLVSEFILGIFSTTFSPARMALMPELVHPNQLLQANSLTNAAGTIASLIGFLIGGALLAWQPSYAMFVDAGTFLGSATCILLMHMPRSMSQAAVKKAGNPIRDLADGLRYMSQHKHTIQVIGLMFLFWACGGLMLNGLTGIITHEFGLSISNYSYFMGVVGLGMIVGAALVSLAREGIPKEVGIAWSMFLVGVFLLGFSLMRQWYTALPFLMIAALFGAVLLVSLETLLQRIVPNYIRGRVMGVKDVISTVGIIGVAIPLAIDENIDRGIRMVMMGLAVVVMGVGLALMVVYYRRQVFPLPVAIARRIVIIYLWMMKKFDVCTASRVPVSGPAIVVSNHTTAFDPLCLQAASKLRLLQFMMAKEYYLKKPMYWMYKWLRVIPVNRTGNDTASIRTALRTLSDGGCIGMFPEGKISDDGRLLEGRQGVALLALMSGATVVPMYIQGTNTYLGMVKDFLARTHVKVYFGTPLKFDDLKGRARDEEARAIATERIMAAIRTLRDRYETNPERRVSSAEAAARSGAASPIEPGAATEPPAATVA